jgi:hypothetical protein
MRLATTSKETESVAKDQSRLGGSVRRFTRKTLSLLVEEEGLQEQRKRRENRTTV